MVLLDVEASPAGLTELDIARNLDSRLARRTLVAKLPPRQKISLVCFRRADPDEILIVPREVKRMVIWGLPSIEAETHEPARDAALRLAGRHVREPALRELELGVTGTYRVSDGPNAGEWTERFHGVEVPAGVRAIDGGWVPHYEAKVQAGADAPRVREAITRLRELAKLKP